jgi:hypothetical protein
MYCMLSASGRNRIPITSSIPSSSHPAIKNAFLELTILEIRTEDIAWKSDGRRPEEVLRDILGYQFPNPHEFRSSVDFGLGSESISGHCCQQRLPAHTRLSDYVRKVDKSGVVPPSLATPTSLRKSGRSIMGLACLSTVVDLRRPCIYQ